MEIMDKAGEQFWTQFWQGKKLPPPIRVGGRGPRAWFYQEFDQLWRAYLPAATARPLRLLEIGCAQSRWLPYFARDWGYQVAGLDYSELGCAQSRALLDWGRGGRGYLSSKYVRPSFPPIGIL